VKKLCFAGMCLFAFAVCAEDVERIKVTGSMPQKLLCSGAGRVFLLGPDGRILWKKDGCGNIHKVLYRDGTVYYSNGQVHAVDVKTGEDRVVVSSPNPGNGIYGFALEADGAVLWADNSTDLVGVGTRALAKVDTAAKDPHQHFRMVCRADADYADVCCSGACRVKRVPLGDGTNACAKAVRETAVPTLAFDVVPGWKKGERIVSHLDGVVVYDAEAKAVWKYSVKDVPAEYGVGNLCGVGLMSGPDLPRILVFGTYANGKPDASAATAIGVDYDTKQVVFAVWAKDHNMMFAEPVSVFPVR